MNPIITPGLTRLVEYLPAILPTPESCRIIAGPEGVEFPRGRGYFIDWPQINTPSKLAHWVAHLAAKTWVDKETLQDLIGAVDHRFDLGILAGTGGGV